MTTHSSEEPRQLTIAIIGNPNTGKSTLFNRFAGAHARVGNYPGVTVEKKIGTVEFQGNEIQLIDLPGTYSLAPRSIDEMLAVDVLLGRQPDTPNIDGIICIADASNLERNLYLFSQIMDLAIPVVLVLNMQDVAQSRGMTIHSEKMSDLLGQPVICTTAHQNLGVDKVLSALIEVVSQPVHQPLDLFPSAFQSEREQLHSFLAENESVKYPRFLIDRLILDVGGYIEAQFEKHQLKGLTDHLQAARLRLKESQHQVPALEAKLRYAWARNLLKDVVQREQTHVTHTITTSDKIDSWLTHRLFGFAFFIMVMLFVFQSVFNWALPLMDMIENTQGWIELQVTSALSPGPFRSMVIDGVIAGVGGVLVFLPQIVFLYLFIAVLEDCGYMARAAFIMDRLMRSFGLSGKSFIPLMSSFACAIPGVMATRVIENRNERLATIMIAPLMSCSARWPVYTLFIAAFIPANVVYGSIYGYTVISLQGLVLFGMSTLGLLLAIPIAWVLKKTILSSEPAPFVMELPSYKWPVFKNVLIRVYDRAKSFVTKAGTLIFATSILVWAAGYFPGDHSELYQVQTSLEALESPQPELDTGENNNSDQQNDLQISQREKQLEDLQNRENSLSSSLLESSLLGRTGQIIEPLVKPLGWDWKIGVATLASFPAREVIIATLGTIYSLGGDVDEEDAGLVEQVQASTWPDGRPVFNIPVALSVMVFFALCAQCAATLMVIQRETNSWYWPLFSFVYMTCLAYVGALITYQVGMLF